MPGSHKSNPLSVMHIYEIHTLGHLGGDNRCGGDTHYRVTKTATGERRSGLPKPR